MKQEDRLEHIKKIELGDKARNFLQSSEWTEIVKPIIDSMLLGVVDIRSLKSAEINSEAKAQVEVKARKMVAEYISEIEVLINAFMTDGDVSRSILDKEAKASDLYQEVK